MLIRRHLAIALGAVALCLPGLSACGFDLATDRPYTPAVGVESVEGSVDVLGAVIVSTEPGAGTFIASLANNDQTAPATFEAFETGAEVDVEAAAFTPVEIPAGGLVNLALDGVVPVTGEFEAGNFVAVVLRFGTGERAAMEIPVVPNSGEYAGLDGEAPVPTESSGSPESTPETESE